MACYAAFGLDRRVLKSKRAGFIGVTVKAKLVLRSGRAQLSSEESAVRIVAAAAGYKPFIHLVVKRLGEIRPNIEMAGVAKLWLLRFQELGLYFRAVNGMAVNAADIILQVLRAQKVRVLLAKFMAAQTTL